MAQGQAWENEAMKPATNMQEGAEARARFDESLRRILTVSKSEMQSREAEYRKQSEANPNRPGPKKKRKPTA